MSAPEPVAEIDTAEAGRRMARGALVLDIREQDEWDAGRIEGSLHIPMGELVARQDELPTERALVVVCRSGGRSARVASALVAAEYDAVNLAGGLIAWVEAGQPLEADGGAPGTVA
jgi:rhodanese-related sulfurtransferase